MCLHIRLLQNLSHGWSISFFLLEQVPSQFNQLFAARIVAYRRKFRRANLEDECGQRLCLEGELQGNKLIQNNSERPHICPLSVRLILFTRHANSFALCADLPK